jgi:cellulose synthase/poly-beta-1,6-N-acetylglucosamine synthase-like glycosyltransferase
MAVRTVILACTAVVTALFFLYGFNCYYLLSVLRRYRCPVAPPLNGKRPRVAIHLPVYNEKYVVGRLLRACARMARFYGADLVRIVVIDDSDDDTTQEIDRLAPALARRGISIEVLRRAERTGFKAGALQLALERCREEFIAVFDADFVPPPRFLAATVPFMLGDGLLGVVQCRWEHMNAGFNIITRAVSLGIDVHFLVEQPARHCSGCFLNFNGSAGVIRVAALRMAGGWQTDTLSEDLDASYRLQMEGYRIMYLRNLAIPSEVPPTVPGFRKQQARWACGSLRTARKLLPRMLADRRIDGRRRLQGFIHLTSYMVHPLMFISFLLAAAGAFFDVRVPWTASTLLPGAAVWGAILSCTVAVWVYPLTVLRARRLNPVRNLPSLLILGLLGFGICFNNTVEAVKALLSSKAWSFRRTPKYAIRRRGDDWRGKAYQVRLDFTSVIEAALAVVGAAATTRAFVRSSYLLAPLLLFYTAAFSFVTVMTFLQGRRETNA